VDLYIEYRVIQLSVSSRGSDNYKLSEPNEYSSA